MSEVTGLEGLIAEFMERWGVDREQAKTCLELCGWDMQVGVQIIVTKSSQSAGICNQGNGIMLSV